MLELTIVQFIQWKCDLHHNGLHGAHETDTSDGRALTESAVDGDSKHGGRYGAVRGGGGGEGGSEGGGEGGEGVLWGATTRGE